MKISLSTLEEAMKNPQAFLRAAKKPKTGFRYSRYMVLRTVALAYHEEGDLASSETQLTDRLSEKFKSTKGNDACVTQLRGYVSAFTALGTTVAKVRDRVRVVLPEQYEDDVVTGEISRLDLHPAGGYRAWLLSNRTEAWQDEIRFPLLQEACAAQLGVDVDEVVPGIYDFSTGLYTEIRSNKQDILRAGRKLRTFLDELKTIS